MKRNLEIKFVLSLIFAILVALFAIQNSTAVEINFLFARFTISQALIILISAIVGAIVILLISLVSQMSLRKKNKELLKEVEEKNEEIIGLKNRIGDLVKDNDISPDFQEAMEQMDTHIGQPIEEESYGEEVPYEATSNIDINIENMNIEAGNNEDQL